MIYYVFISQYCEDYDGTRLVTVHGFSQSYAVVSCFNSMRDKFPALKIIEVNTNNELEFYEYIKEVYGIVDDYEFGYLELKLITNRMGTKSVPVYDEDNTDLTVYIYNDNFGELEYSIIQLIKFERFIKNIDNWDKPAIMRLIAILKMYIETCKRGKRSMFELFDKNSLLIEQIEKEGTNYYDYN